MLAFNSGRQRGRLIPSYRFHAYVETHHADLSLALGRFPGRFLGRWARDVASGLEISHVAISLSQLRVSSVYAPGVVHTDLSRTKNSPAFLFHGASDILIQRMVMSMLQRFIIYYYCIVIIVNS
ncbi:hypothetical protein PUN28_003467 [Cardiocondyla obscurior]|uniref:Uncharacterized protein n=1 Tax=Cardiocondyla obscurior TaxID=286306 RepID=A0AAW2GM35_9HYME